MSIDDSHRDKNGEIRRKHGKTHATQNMTPDGDGKRKSMRTDTFDRMMRKSGVDQLQGANPRCRMKLGGLLSNSEARFLDDAIAKAALIDLSALA
jgi:hypothetical protein